MGKSNETQGAAEMPARENIPEISIDTHVERARVALGRDVAAKTPIYLDTKFWVLLRDAATKENPSAIELLSLLDSLVAKGKVFCPISEDVFLELLKQSDPISRRSTAALIDRLSLGVSLIDTKARIGTEIASFIYSSSGERNLHPLENLVWCKIPYLMGIVHPSNTPFSEPDELKFQKMFFDVMWGKSILDVVDTIDDRKNVPVSFTELTQKLNADIDAHKNDIQSFKQVYLAEIRGMIDLVADVPVTVIGDLARKRGIDIPNEAGISSESKFMWKNLLCASLEKNKSQATLRTIHIHSSLHASLRWDKKRQLKPNDLLDFNHAAAALAYCDVFLTDNPLRVMITQSPTRIDQFYNCKVISEASKAADYLKERFG